MKVEKVADEDEQIQRLDCSITDFPSPILVHILVRLSVKMILVCKCVSKTWRSLISNPQFAKLHFSRQKPCTLLRTLGSRYVSSTLYLVEPETCSNFDLGYCTCSGGYYSDQCFQTCHMKIDTKLKIPLRNDETVLNYEVGVKRKRYIKVKPKDQRFKIVNSCNGFLCLCEPSRNVPIVVCNPITGEYTNIPVAETAGEKSDGFVDCGFGFSPRCNQYKVIRLFSQWNGEIYGASAKILTLGTGSWKSIDGGPNSPNRYDLAFPTYLEGCIHWLCVDKRGSDSIVSFNFDNEQFQSVPPPPRENDDTSTISLSRRRRQISMGVLEDCLCICESAFKYITIWIMKKYGVQESWTKVSCIDIRTDERWPVGLYQPLKYFDDGTLLMLNDTYILIYYDPKGTNFKYLKIFGIRSGLQAIPHVPSFISLKEAVFGDNAVVLNIDSRGAEFDVDGEFNVSLVEKESYFVSDSDSDSDSDSGFDDHEKWRKLLYVFQYS